MSWLNTNYILRAGVLSVLLLLPGLMSATCKRDTIINNYKDDSLRFIIKDDSIITFRNGESSFTIIKADSPFPQKLGTDYPDSFQNTICRKYGIALFRYRMGLWKT